MRGKGDSAGVRFFFRRSDRLTLPQLPNRLRRFDDVGQVLLDPQFPDVEERVQLSFSVTSEISEAIFFISSGASGACGSINRFSYRWLRQR